MCEDLGSIPNKKTSKTNNFIFNINKIILKPFNYFLITLK